MTAEKPEEHAGEHEVAKTNASKEAIDATRTETEKKTTDLVGEEMKQVEEEGKTGSEELKKKFEEAKKIFEAAKPENYGIQTRRFLPTPSLGVSNPQQAINSSVPYVGLAAATGLVAGASSIASLPVLGKIPFLPAVAGGIQSGIGSLTNYLGMNTGPTLATNATLAGWPTFVGPTSVGALSLWLLGKANEKLTGRTATGLNIFKTMWNGVRAPVDLPIKGLQKLGDGISWASGAIFGNKTKKGLIGKTFGLTKSLIANNYKAALAGTAAAIFIAPATGGSSLIWGLTGFVATKLLSKTPAAGGGAAVPDAHAH